MKQVIILIAALVLAACGPSADSIEATSQARAVQIAQATVERIPTQTPAPTVAIEITVEVTRIVTKVVTATPTNTPQGPTPTPSNTPDISETATAQALGPLISPKGDGFYLVGVDILPGLWRSTGTADDCYWARTNRNGDIIDNHFGLAGGTVLILASDFQFETLDCGIWEYLGE